MSARVVCWWSAGTSSASAAKLTLAQYPDAVIAYCDTSASEHTDNLRFLHDCEHWYGKKILRLRSEKYRDTWDVFEKTRYLAGIDGARCTTELKKLVRRKFQRPDDLQVFGFTADEAERVTRFRGNNPEVSLLTPLIDRGMTKPNCHAFVRGAGIDLPAMYSMGYRNNNCIGCVKGGQGYWNKIRRDFPSVFDRMARVERELGVALNKDRTGGTRKKLFLDELRPDAGRYAAEPDIQCGVYCEDIAE